LGFHSFGSIFLSLIFLSMIFSVLQAPVANARDPSASLPAAAIFSDRRRAEMPVENSGLRG